MNGITRLIARLAIVNVSDEVIVEGTQCSLTKAGCQQAESETKEFHLFCSHTKIHMRSSSNKNSISERGNEKAFLD